MNNLLPIGILSNYQIYHDIGKPLCKTYDENGNYHFYDHAKISAEKYLKDTKDKLISLLILNDMNIHTFKASEIEKMIKEIPELTISLLITGLAEIHANADMFGGLDSIGFKIKYKQINQRGKQILKLLNGGL